MADKENKTVDTRIKQTRRGYATPRRIRELRIGRGNVVGGWTIANDGAFTSDPDANGARIILDSANKRLTFEGGVTLQNTGIPETDTGGMAVKHDGIDLMMEVAGPGVGSGAYAAFKNTEGTVFIGVRYNELLGLLIVAEGLPTSFVGLPSGTIWNDGGTLKIVP
jgi:hypothetical protein